MLAERDFELKKETETFYKSERQRWSERQRHALDTLVREMVNKAAVVAERTLVALDDADAAAAAEQVASRRRTGQLVVSSVSAGAAEQHGRPDKPQLSRCLPTGRRHARSRRHAHFSVDPCGAGVPPLPTTAA